MPSPKQVANAKAIEERRAKALNLRSMGMQVTAIAKQLGVSKATISTDISEALRDISAEEKETCRLIQRKTLMDLRRALSPAALRGDVPSVNSIRGLLDHEAKLLGLYAPVQTEVDLTSSIADFEKTTAELLATINSATEPEQDTNQ